MKIPSTICPICGKGKGTKGLHTQCSVILKAQHANDKRHAPSRAQRPSEVEFLIRTTA